MSKLLCVLSCVLSWPSSAGPLQRILFPPELVESRGLKCLDGSPAGYYLRRQQTSNSWAFHLEGGGLCVTPVDCRSRMQGNLGSSKRWPSTRVEWHGVLDTRLAQNPFAEFNHVFLPYCSGDTWTGTQREPNPFVGGITAGHLIIEAILEHLLNTTNMSTDGVDRVLWSGESAGAIGVLHNADFVSTWFKTHVGQSVKVKAMAKSGLYFPEGVTYFPAVWLFGHAITPTVQSLFMVIYAIILCTCCYDCYRRPRQPSCLWRGWWRHKGTATLADETLSGELLQGMDVELPLVTNVAVANNVEANKDGRTLAIDTSNGRVPRSDSSSLDSLGVDSSLDVIELKHISSVDVFAWDSKSCCCCRSCRDFCYISLFVLITVLVLFVEVPADKLESSAVSMIDGSYTDESCLAALGRNANSRGSCWDAPVLIRHLTTPTFLAQNLFDANLMLQVLCPPSQCHWTWQRSVSENIAGLSRGAAVFISDIGLKTRATLEALSNEVGIGVFAPACYRHVGDLCMVGGPRVNGLTLNQTLAAWFFDDGGAHTSKPHVQIEGFSDAGAYPSNSHCAC